MLETGYLRETQTKIAFDKKALPLIRNSPVITQSVATFIENPRYPERSVEGFKHLGTGNHSIVYGFGNIALKLSTGFTGKLTYKHGVAIPPENLILQSQFLTTLGNHIDKNNISEISTPKQFFAARSASGNFLSLHENLEEKMTMTEWMVEKKLTIPEEIEILETTKGRILALLGSFSLKKGLNDLGLETGASLSSRNIMISRDTTDPASAELSIIDQPSKGAIHSIGGILNNMFYFSTKNDFDSLDDFLDV
jgi:hypothetical protein